MTRSELEDLEPWRDPSDPDNKTKVQVNVVVQDSKEDKTKTPPPNPLRKTTVKDDKGWPLNLERSDSETIDLTKEDVAENIKMDVESEPVDIGTPTPAKTENPS